MTQSSGFQEFVALGQAELHRQEELRPRTLEALRAERDQLQQEQSGIRQSLRNGDLAASLRTDLERDYAELDRRLTAIASEMSQAENARAGLEMACDLQRVAQELKQIAQALTGSNAPAANLALSRVVETISVGADGSVRIRMAKFAFLISPTQIDGELCAPRGRPSRQRLPARAVPVDVEAQLRSELRPNTSIDPARFAGFGSEWFWTDELQIPVHKTWVEEHGVEVAEYRLSQPCSLDKSQHFGKCKRTIRACLKFALEQGVDALRIDARSLHGNWAREHALEVAAFLAVPGCTITEAAKHSSHQPRKPADVRHEQPRVLFFRY